MYFTNIEFIAYIYPHAFLLKNDGDIAISSDRPSVERNPTKFGA